MALLDTPETALDHKYWRIVLEASADVYGSNKELAQAMEEKEFVEFSFVDREGDTQYVKWTTISSKVTLARAFNLLNDKIKPTAASNLYRKLENFQSWLGQKVLKYLDDSGCPADQIVKTAQRLLHEDTSVLPTADNLLKRFPGVKSKTAFKESLKIITLLKPGVFQLRSVTTLVGPSVAEV